VEIYKYVTPERVDILSGKRIRFTPPPFFNDPLESSPVLNFDIGPEEWRRIGEIEQETLGLPEELFERVCDTEQIARHMPAVLDMMVSMLQRGVGVLSLTERPDNLVMWAHYADLHRGFVLGFNSTHPWFEASDKFRVNILAKVRYANDRPSKGSKTLTLEDTYLTKSTDWSYEEEWRKFRFLSLADQCIETGSEPVHLFSFPPELITRVIVGCRATTETRQKLVEVLGQEEYRHVEMRIAELDKRHYKLNF